MGAGRYVNFGDKAEEMEMEKDVLSCEIAAKAESIAIWAS